MRDPGSIPRVLLMWNWDSPVSVVSLKVHWWPRRDWSLWPRLRRASSWTVTRPSCWQCDNPTWSHTALLSGFTLAEGPPSGFTTDIVGCWGGALWRACYLTAFIHSSTGPPVYLSWGTWVQSPGGIVMWNLDSPFNIGLLQATSWCISWHNNYQT